MLRYCSLPSARRRLSRSAMYFFFSASGSKPRLSMPRFALGSAVCDIVFLLPGRLTSCQSAREEIASREKFSNNGYADVVSLRQVWCSRSTQLSRPINELGVARAGDLSDASNPSLVFAKWNASPLGTVMASNPIETSLELVSEKCPDLTPFVYERLFAEYPDMNRLFWRDTTN